jgi:hypothetical protein
VRIQCQNPGGHSKAGIFNDCGAGLQPQARLPPVLPAR